MATRVGAILKGALKHIPGLKSSYYLGMALQQMAADQWRPASSFDRIFEAGEDPWISTSESERQRFRVTLSTLDAADRDHFGSAVEIGCAEGIFTEVVAPRCRSLEALDYSAIALTRARQRVSSAHVTFRQWDMRTERLPGAGTDWPIGPLPLLGRCLQ